MVSDDDLPANPLILPFPSTQAQVSCDLRRTMKLYGIKAWHASVEVGIPKYVYVYIYFLLDVPSPTKPCLERNNSSRKQETWRTQW